MNTSYKIRKAENKDLENLVKLQDQYRVFYKCESNQEASKRFLEELKPSDSTALIAEDNNGEIVGFARLFPIQSLLSFSTNWVLNDLYVSVNHRKHGVGSLLLKSCEEFGKQHDSQWLMLRTAKTNLTAQSVYEKANWKKDPVLRYELYN